MDSLHKPNTKMSNTIRKNDIVQQEEIEKALQSIADYVKNLKLP